MQLGRTDMALGIELVRLEDNLFSCRSVLLSKKANSVLITQGNLVSGTLSTVMATLPKNHPIALTLSGQGIIHKNQSIGEKTGPDQLFSIAFPAIDRKEFYVQQVYGDQDALVSIVRKSQADDLLAKMNGAGFQVYMLSLGGIVTMSIWPQLNVYGTKIQFDGHLFNLTDTKSFSSYQFDPQLKGAFPMKIDQEPIPEENVVAYATAFQLLLHENISPIVADADELHNNLITFNAQRKIKNIALIFVFAIFFLLLVSFLTFVHYNEENAALSGRLGSITANSDQLELTKQSIAEHKALLKEMNWNGGYNYGFLVNEIGASMPKQLNLKSISTGELKGEKDSNILSNLKITGTTSNLTAVNNWIFVLKEKTWVKSVKLERFQEDPDTDVYQFNLVLNY